MSEIHAGNPGMQIETRYFGTIDSESGLLIEFPAGLPAFEEQHSFLAIEHPRTAPVIFLQSMSTRELCFLALPILTIDPAYEVQISPEDLAAMGAPADRPPEVGKDIAALALIAVTPDGRTTANLMSPVIVNLANCQAFQIVRTDRAYSWAHPVANLGCLGGGTEDTCS
jgi:flagellar assembly factor FliW